MGDVGRYRVIKLIGRGGMAEVLEAIAQGEHGFERRVAIKRLLASDSSDVARYERMFLDEARIAAQLHHANIVAVLDYGVADGRPFQVLEHIDGRDLRSLITIPGHPLPIELALYIISVVAHALEYAHTMVDAHGKALGIVHRDVTPANVLVAWSGDIKLTDFGIAFAHKRTEQTHAGMTKGTPLFMSPEQLMGDRVDGRADLFSLGCVLHTIIAGWSPLSKGDQPFLLVSGVELELAPELPEDVRAIIARATRCARGERYQSAGALAADLAAAIARRGVIDPRSALRNWMAVARDPSASQVAPAPGRGRLDALLGGDVVLERTAENHRFRTIQTVAAIPSAGARNPEADVRPSAAVTTQLDAPVTDPIDAPATAQLVAPVNERVAPANDHRAAPTRALVSPRDPMTVPTRTTLDAAPARSSRTVIVLVLAFMAAVATVLVVVLGSGDSTSPAPPAEPPKTIALAPDPDAAIVDAAAALTEPADASEPAVEVDAAVPDDAGTKRAATSPPPPQIPVLAYDPSVQRAGRWSKIYPRVMEGFQNWIDEHSDAAAAFAKWDYETGGSRELLMWMTQGSDVSVATAVTRYKGRSLGTLISKHRAAYTALVGWVRANPRGCEGLVRRELGLPWGKSSLAR